MSATIAPTLLPEDEELEPRGRLRLVLVGLVVLLAAAAAVWFLVLAPAEAEPGEPVEGAVVALDPLTTTTGTASLSHARVALALVLAEGSDEATVVERAPLLQDALLREVATMNADQLRSSEGSDALRANLTAHAQQVWPDGEVLRVVLTELLVQ